jgi:TRAP-type C4-dicarboxylate transport system permease small subunit
VSYIKIGVGMINMKSKRKIFVEKIINILLNVLIFVFGIILLISIYTGVQTRILGNNYANFFGYSIFKFKLEAWPMPLMQAIVLLLKLLKMLN